MNEILKRYKTALANFDWTFEMSDDSHTRNRAKAKLADLWKMQAEVDPTGEIWLSTPGSKQMTAPAPKVKT